MPYKSRKPIFVFLPEPLSRAVELKAGEMELSPSAWVREVVQMLCGRSDDYGEGDRIKVTLPKRLVTKLDLISERTGKPRSEITAAALERLLEVPPAPLPKTEVPEYRMTDAELAAYSVPLPGRGHS